MKVERIQENKFVAVLAAVCVIAFLSGCELEDADGNDALTADGKVQICHNGNSLEVSQNSAQAHYDNHPTDTVGVCPDEIAEEEYARVSDAYIDAGGEVYMVVDYDDVTQEMIDDATQTSFATLRHTTSGTDQVILSYITERPESLSFWNEYTHLEILVILTGDEWAAPSF